MLDILKELFDEFFEEIFKIPGAFICWLLKGCKLKFRDELKFRKRNMAVGAIFWFIVIALIVIFVSKIL